LQPQILET
jgi:hypothetical protein